MVQVMSHQLCRCQYAIRRLQREGDASELRSREITTKSLAPSKGSWLQPCSPPEFLVVNFGLWHSGSIETGVGSVLNEIFCQGCADSLCSCLSSPADPTFGSGASSTLDAAHHRYCCRTLACEHYFERKQRRPAP